MLSSTYGCDSSYIPLGKRRGNLDLCRFPLDLSWIRAEFDSARGRAYPSPPMSGSPPLPSRSHPDITDDRAQAGFNVGLPARDVPRPLRTPQIDFRENARVAPDVSFQQEPHMHSPAYSYRRGADIPDVSVSHPQYGYQHHQSHQQRPLHHLAEPLPLYPLHHHPPPGSFIGSDAGTIAEASSYTSPKAQRKTKGHVASACVPCKKAHLRCDTQRPCSRCTSNSKEESCVDVQHKKRGRPRLRDERDQQFDTLGQQPSVQPDMMRRPMLYSPSESVGLQPDASHRAGPYRVIKSQSGAQVIPRHLGHASSADANIYSSGQPPLIPHVTNPTEQPSAYLNMEMQISRVSRTFCDAIGIPLVAGRNLLDMVVASDRDKVYRLKRLLDDERQEREPNYLPPIYGRTEEDRVMQSMGFGSQELAQLRTNHQDVLTFQGPDGQQRPHPVRSGLVKKESTYFVVLVITGTPVTLLGVNQLPSPPYSRESAYRYNPQQSFGPPQVSPYGQFLPHFGDPRSGPQGAHQPPQSSRSDAGCGSSAAPNTSRGAEIASRLEYDPAQFGRQAPRGGPSLGQCQSELRLPPIKSTPGMAPASAPRTDDRGGRVDIGGLLENPEPQRRRL